MFTVAKMNDEKIIKKIKDSALNLFNKLSYQKTSVADIANASGISKSIIYSYFSSKEDIIASIIKDKIYNIIKKKNYYFDKKTSLDDKLLTIIYKIIDLVIETKDLIFGSYENLMGKIVKDIFDRVMTYENEITEFIINIVKSNNIDFKKSDQEAKEDVKEYFLIIFGRILQYLMTTDWKNLKPLKLKIKAVYYKIFDAIVLK